MKVRLANEGKSPLIIGDEIQDTDNYAIRFGWAAFWALSDQERARVVATMQVEDEINFVSSHWSQYGDNSSRAVAEDAPETPEETDRLFD